MFAVTQTICFFGVDLWMWAGDGVEYCWVLAWMGFCRLCICVTSVLYIFWTIATVKNICTDLIN